MPLSRLVLALGLACAVLAAAPAPARSDAGAAREAFERGAYEDAFAEAQALARQGDADAQRLLGLMLRDGLGVEPDPAAALSWLLCAAASQRGSDREAAPQGDAPQGGAAPSAAELAEQLAKSLDEATLGTARKAAATCAAKPREPSRRASAEQDEGAGSGLGLGNIEIDLGRSLEALRQLAREGSGGGATQAQSGSGFDSFFHRPKRRSLWSKAAFLPGDATIVGTQYVAWEVGARDFFWDLRHKAVDHEALVSGFTSVFWWLVILKAIWTIARVLTDRRPTDRPERDYR